MSSRVWSCSQEHDVRFQWIGYSKTMVSLGISWFGLEINDFLLLFKCFFSKSDEKHSKYKLNQRKPKKTNKTIENTNKLMIFSNLRSPGLGRPTLRSVGSWDCWKSFVYLYSQGFYWFSLVWFVLWRFFIIFAKTIEKLMEIIIAQTKPWNTQRNYNF